MYSANATNSLIAYEVIMDVAFLHPHTKEWQVVVLGPRLPVMSLSVRNFTTDAQKWLERWKKRNPGQIAPQFDAG